MNSWECKIQRELEGQDQVLSCREQALKVLKELQKGHRDKDVRERKL